MPAHLRGSARDRFLRGRHVAVLTTVAEDGSPVSTPIWYLYRDGVFYFRTAESAVRTRHIRRDPRVSICVQDERPPYKSVTASGAAEIRPGDDRLARLMPRRYLGFIGGIGYQLASRGAIETGEEVTLAVRPRRYLSSDFTPETPAFGRVWLQLKRVLPPWL
jgi:PPOX class probable F420-dependent enzyme